MTKQRNTDEIALTILNTRAVEIREVPHRVTNEEVDSLPLKNQPFLYSSGNWGPGYVSIKGLVGYGEVMPFLARQLATQIKEKKLSIDFVAANVTGGVIPGWQISQELKIPFMYVQGTRKKDKIESPITIVNKDNLLKMSEKISQAILQSDTTFNFVAGLVPSGMIPGFQLSRFLSERLNRVTPFVYIRETRKKGGQKEVITGIKNNPFITPGDTGIVISQATDFTGTVEKGIKALQNEGFKAIDGANLLSNFEPKAINDIKKIEIPLNEAISPIPKASKGIVIEELINFAQSTTNSADMLKESGYQINCAGTVLFYNNPESIKALDEHKIEIVQVVSLPDLISAAKKHQTHSQKAIDDYQTFLTNPSKWQELRGLRRVEKGGTR